MPSPAASAFLRRKHAQMKAKAAALTPPRSPRLVLQTGQGARVDPRVATVRGVSTVTDVAALFPSLAALAPSNHITNSNSRKDKESSKTKASRKTSTPEEKEERRLAMARRLANQVSGNGSNALSPNNKTGGRVYSLLMSPERRHRTNDGQSDQRRQRPLVSTWMTVGSAAG